MSNGDFGMSNEQGRAMTPKEAIELLPVLDGEMNTSIRRMKSLLSHMERHAYFDQEDVDDASDVVANIWEALQGCSVIAASVRQGA